VASFGRDEDVAALRDLLSDARLVTITGRAGVGKAHLAGQIARSRPAGDAVTVPLADIVSPDLVVPEIAGSLGIALVATSDPLTAVALRIGTSETLLVLLGFERVLAAAGEVATLLARCSGLRVLVTSQSALQLREERVYRLGPLPLPDAATSLDLLRDEPAVALYCDRAAAVDSRFELTPGNAIAVAELCRVLEGLPLAIELAAARSATLSAAAIVERLAAEPLDLLRSRRTGATSHHHDLRSAIGWTYALLAPGEQRLLRRLAIPPTTFTLEDAEAIGGGEAIDQLGVLVDFHLVDPHHGTEPTRFAIPSSIRAFALDELRAAGEHDDAVTAYVAWAAQWSRAAIEEAATGDEAEVLGRIAQATENLTHTAPLALRLGLIDEAIDMALATALRWGYAGFRPSHAELLSAIVAASRAVRTGARARLLAFDALLTFHRADPGRIAEIAGLLDEAEALARETGDDVAILESFSVRTLTTPLTGDLDGAARATREGLALASAVGDDRWTARFELLSSAFARLAGDHLTGLELASQALRRSRMSGYDAGAVAAGAILRPLAMRYPELDDIVPTTAQTVALARRIGMAWYDLALLPVLALEAIDSGDVHAARARMTEALQAVRGSGTPTLVGFAVVAASEAAAAEGDDELALALDAATEPYREVIRANMSSERAERHAATIGRCRLTLGEGAAEGAERRGRAMSLGDAVERALERFGPAPSLVVPPTKERGDPATGPQLTPRQLDVLRLIAGGLRNDEIAAELFLSAKTVMHHTTAIYRTLGVRGRTEATVWALRYGLADPVP
jgi:predicted ATPase/DNA-binding CsgD family transcriptional regulator